MNLSDAALDWALAHIKHQGDTDILPTATEFSAIADRWASVRGQIAARDLTTWETRPARTFLSPKRSLGFRVATQLDPLDSLVFTALVFEMGPRLEAWRIPLGEKVVHSYRFHPTSIGQMYRPDSTFETFRLHSLSLGEAMGDGYVVLTDISDFFNRLSHHPLENAAVTASGSEGHTAALMRLVGGWTQRRSYGIPVGPAACRLLAEVAIHDVDLALKSRGYVFCRYSDDYRIFAKTRKEAWGALTFLARTLFTNHGLTLQESKTEVIPIRKFLERFARSEEDEERGQMKDSFAALLQQVLTLSVNQWAESLDDEHETTDEPPGLSIDFYSEINYEDLTPEQQQIVDQLNLWQILRAQFVREGGIDVPLTRFVLSRIAQLRLEDTEDLLLSDVEKLYPVFPHAIKAVAAQAPHLSVPRRQELGERLLALLEHPVIGQLEYHRHWILSVFSDPSWNQVDALTQIYERYSDSLTRTPVMEALGAADAQFWVRTKKNDLLSLPHWERRALLTAGRCLPRDEARHWFRVVQDGLDPLEQEIAEWARPS